MPAGASLSACVCVQRLDKEVVGRCGGLAGPLRADNEMKMGTRASVGVRYTEPNLSSEMQQTHVESKH